MSRPVHSYRRLILTAAGIALSCLLTSCVGTSPTTRYYALDSGPVSAVSEGEILIAVGPFELPAYLDRPQIVTRTEGTQVQVNKFDRWAEPLDASIVRQINNTINEQLRSVFAYQYPSLTKVQPVYRLRGRIYSFEANGDGTVSLSLRWGVLDENGSFTIAARGANYSTTVDSVADMPAVTAAMGSLIDQLSAEIVAEFRSIGVE